MTPPFCFCFVWFSNFTLGAVDTSEAGRGTLHVALRAATHNVKHNVQNLGNGLLKVLFYPKIPIAHRVDLRYSGVHASGNASLLLLPSFTEFYPVLPSSFERYRVSRNFYLVLPIFFLAEPGFI